MPRPTGGRTPLGQELNKIGSNIEGVRTSKYQWKYGIIKEVVGRKSNQGVYTVILEIIGPDGKSQGTTGPIPLATHPSVMAQTFGAPADLVGRYVCKVEYMGTSINRGIATIVRDLNSDKEATEQTNQVQITGAAFAPPGSGLV